jgi:hypothetical protein
MKNNREGKGWDMGINMFFFGIAVLCLKKKRDPK